jgi:hypothetical protein
MMGRVDFTEAVAHRLRMLEADDVAARLWEADTTLWKAGDKQHQRVIANSLGWLGIAREVHDQIPGLLDFVADVRAEDYRHAVLLGMGGSSLAPEVMYLSFGRAPGYLDLTVLDTTDPAAIAAAEAALDLSATLFIVASKSGGTTETACLHAYFYDRLVALEGVEQAGRHFVAITDEGTALERQALEQQFRAIFINAGDIGGRYSALSFFGMVPAALVGVDLDRLLTRAMVMAEECSAEVEAPDNEALVFGASLAQLALVGRDKLTIVASPSIGGFGAWAEQLVAESTGKEGHGILPVELEPLGPPEVYGDDRAFVYVRLLQEFDPGQDKVMETLEGAGLPVIHRTLDDVYDMGAQFLLWEISVAVAGAVLASTPSTSPTCWRARTTPGGCWRRWSVARRSPCPSARRAGRRIRPGRWRPRGGAPRPGRALAPPAYVALQAWVTPGAAPGPNHRACGG